MNHSYNGGREGVAKAPAERGQGGGSRSIKRLLSYITARSGGAPSASSGRGGKAMPMEVGKPQTRIFSQ